MSAAAEAPPAVQMLNVQIDGVWLQFPKGTRVIEACLQAQKFIPRYCYHPKLSAPGNCRMCLIEMGMPKTGPDRKPVLGEDGKAEIAWIPRPQISCAQDVAEGMGIRTDSPMVRECRQGVMEFFLINHPLDCPICDQAGECRLQEFSVEYGHAESRFLEHKVKKPKNVELGPCVTLDSERCVLCTRCIRFMKEVAEEDVIGIVDRGSFNSIACHPERELTSNYSLNTVDICPVGALTSSDFRFKMRVWFLKETKSIDVNDGLGCNIIIGSRENRIYRITPRENNDVNSCWMPDSHRLNFKYLHDERRLLGPLVRGMRADWPYALGVAADELRRHARSDAIAMIVSARMTNEELYLVRRLGEALGIALYDVLPRMGEPDGILIPADRNSNTTGAQLLSLTGENPGARLPEIAEGVATGKIKALLTFEDATKCGIDATHLAKLDTLVAMDVLPNKTTPYASVVFASSGFAEKRGSLVNINGRLQRLNRAITPPGEARDDWEILRDLVLAISGANGIYMIEDVFKQLAAEVPALAGLSLSKIGDLGVQLDLARGSESAEASVT